MDLSKRQNKIKLNALISRGHYQAARFACVEYLANHPQPKGLSKSGANQTLQSYIKNFIYFLDNIDNIKGLYNKGKIQLATTSINIYKKGNSKLSFLNYSNSPVSNCPGAAECLTFCYSLNSIRFPAPFVIWLICTIIEKEAPYILGEALSYEINKPGNKKTIQAQGYIDFRLYNDGDFRDLYILKYWMDYLKEHPTIRAYAYSKSWALFLHAVKMYGVKLFPDNFTLNLSSGGRYHNLKDIMKTFKFVRGEFLAVKISQKVAAHKMTKEQRRELMSAARERGIKKAFICPGLCGSCTTRGHACGDNKTFKNYTIITPEH